MIFTPTKVINKALENLFHSAFYFSGRLIWFIWYRYFFYLWAVYVKVFLRKKISARLSTGHPWVFANEIGAVEGNVASGDVVSVFSFGGSFVGTGYYNPDSKISIRFLTHNPKQVIDRNFFKEKIEYSCALRIQVGMDEPVQRLVSGEADFLPGLTVDKLDNYIVFQTYTLGMERWKDVIAATLNDIFPNATIFEKNNGRFRKPEQLPIATHFWYGEEVPSFLLECDSVVCRINLNEAPRMGIYWEQYLIADFIRPFTIGKRVLDVFCYQGFVLFSALKSGAASTVGIDWNEKNIDSAEENKRLNNLNDDIVFHCANSFEALSKLKFVAGFDLIIIDIPALSGIGKDIQKVLSGYERILTPAIDLLLEDGKILLTMNGRQFDEKLIWEQVGKIASSTNKTWQIISELNQPADHPQLWNVVETKYFRAWLLAFRQL